MRRYYIREEDRDGFVRMARGEEARCIPALALKDSRLGKKTLLLECWLFRKDEWLYEVSPEDCFVDNDGYLDVRGLVEFDEDRVTEVGPVTEIHSGDGFWAIEIESYAAKGKVCILDTLPSCVKLDMGGEPKVRGRPE